jgi:hypothetical protein
MPVKEASMEAIQEAGFSHLEDVRPTGGWASMESAFEDYVREYGVTAYRLITN